MTAINFPSTPTNGQFHTDGNGLVWKYNGYAWEPYIGSSIRVFSGARIELSSNVNLSSANASISFTTEVYDSGNYYTSEQPTKCIAPETGYYRINAKLFTGSGGNGNSYRITVKKNGSTDLASVSAGPNQAVVFDEVVYLFKNDYVEFYAKETNAIGTITTDTVIEFVLAGTAVGTTTFNNANAFSGVKVKLTSIENLNGANTAITWDSTEFNVNADVSGNVYWSASNSANVKIYTTGYYRVQAYIQVGSAGSTNSYNVNLRKNNTTNLTTAKLSPNDSLSYDETILLNTDDYLQIQAAETGASGTITTNSYFLVSRTGV